MIHKSGDVDDDFTHLIKVGWLKWRVTTSGLCDKKDLFKLKENFYKLTPIGPLYLVNVFAYEQTSN